MSQNQETRTAPTYQPLQNRVNSFESSAAKARLLLVEDHDVNQVLIQAMTKRLGYETVLAADGTEAVERVDQSISEENPFDLVLMDIQMPFMDGYEATRMIRTSGVSEDILPIIAITANAFGDDIRNCLAAGMQAHISKPIDIANLDSVLRQWLKPRRLEEDCSPTTEAQSCLSGDLVARYRLRREGAINSVASLLRRGTFSGMEIREVADQMHKLAGTAGMFGEENLGNHAKLIEDGLKQWKIAERPQKLQTAVERLLEAA